MNPTAIVRRAAFACFLLLTAAGATGCADEVAVAGPEVAVYPSDAYIATAAPVYYEGRPAYYYGNRWYYRDGGRWGYYRNEPAYLQSRRGYGYGYRAGGGVGVRYNVRGGYYRGGRR
jgi:hypothetical protein